MTVMRRQHAAAPSAASAATTQNWPSGGNPRRVSPVKLTANTVMVV